MNSKICIYQAIVDKNGKFIGFATSNVYPKPTNKIQTEDGISTLLDQDKYKELRKIQEKEISLDIEYQTKNNNTVFGKKIYR